MWIHPVRRGVAILATVWLVFAVAQGAFAAEALPRYKLQVGQELQYNGSDEFKYDGGKFLTDSTVRIWVVKQNDDGSWRVVLRQGTNFRQEQQKGTGSNHETVHFGWCDVSSDGKVKDNETIGYHFSPMNFLPALPVDQGELDHSWTSFEPKQSLTYRNRLVKDGSSGDRVMIESLRESPENVIYGFEFKDLMTFDRDRGLLERIETSTKQTYGFNGQGKGTLALEQVRMHTAEWCKDFLNDAERYFAIAEKEPAGLSPEALEKRWQVTAAKRQAAKEQIKSPEFLQQIDKDIAQHAQFAGHSLESAKERFAILEKPAADWTCKDFAGKDHTLADLRGRVVVLDFWYRGCGWCIRAMPQVKEIATHFKDQPVTIFGMNTDKKDEDAQFVIDTLALNYENLKAEGIPQKYKVRGFPTVIIIDQQGVVRDLHVGYSPDLKEKVIESIERLLAKKT